MIKDKKSKTTSGKKKKQSTGSRLIKGSLIVLNLLACVALMVSGYAGTISPLQHGGIWGAIGLTFPIVLLCVIVLSAIEALCRRKSSLILVAGLILTGGPILTFCPLNFNFGNDKNISADSSFTLMSYNVANLYDQRPLGTYDSTYNAILSYVIEQDADLICLSECPHLGVSRTLRITPSQFDSLQQRYPHIILSGRAQVTLSKFPIEPIHSSIDTDEFGNGDFGMYRVTLPGGKLLTLFNVHLQSLALTESDKSLYLELTELKHNDIDTVKTKLIHKITGSNVKRAYQTRTLLGLIRHYGGPNVIICGDFNDIPNCYSIRSFEGANLKSVYPEIGFGPMVTFNADRFYFCIDHVLYRGDIRPVSIRKGNTRASDHYPLVTHFEIL